jgi:aminopeptidase-like protein
MRSITGPGFRDSLKILQKEMPLTTESIPSGTQVFDWEIPPEWLITDARLTGPDDEVYADLDDTNLAVMNYSAPVDRHLTLAELEPHLYSTPTLPEATPYVTSYYEQNWGFCLPQKVRDSLSAGEYHAKIDSEFDHGGRLNWGHCVLEGDTDAEVLLSTYLCHPSLANNELSGPLAMMALYNEIRGWERRRYTYRFVVVPETIGSLAYLQKYGEHLQEKLVAGSVLTCLGGPHDGISYKFSRDGTSSLDGVMRYMNDMSGDPPVTIRPFDTSGSDERQYCSPGFNLPVGQFARTVYGEYAEYHTSADDKSFMCIDAVRESVEAIATCLMILERAGGFKSAVQHGEPMMSKRQLYPTVNAPDSTPRSMKDSSRPVDPRLQNIMRLINFADGSTPLIEAAVEYGISPDQYVATVDLLVEHDLLRPI